jgi:hypothetical protein
MAGSKARDASNFPENDVKKFASRMLPSVWPDLDWQMIGD